MEFLARALIMGLSGMIVIGIVRIFTKSDTQKLAENKEKVLINSENSLKEIIEIVIQILSEDSDEALRYLKLSNLSLDDAIEEPERELKSYYFSFYGTILYRQEKFEDAKIYLDKVVEYVESGISKPNDEDKIVYSHVYYYFGGIQYVNGIFDKAEYYRKKAIEFNEEFSYRDFSELATSTKSINN